MNAFVRTGILDTARRKFNEKGYDRVSMREIAEECGMAVGNLTYYYHRKDDLVQAIMQDAFLSAKPEHPILSLADLNDQFSRMIDTLLRYAFYFLDDAFITDQDDHNSAIRQRILVGIRQLQADGLFTPDFDQETQRALLDMLLMTHLVWMRMTLRLSAAPSKADFLRRHWLVLRPYLTEKGKAACENMLKEPPFQ
ncbi:MAG: helix-turn-helix transcriptional regulator [Clostridia bacterium]|nr:helix-turn-helix transcriptional regulator [Clostridia bacterium]